MATCDGECDIATVDAVCATAQHVVCSFLAPYRTRTETSKPRSKPGMRETSGTCGAGSAKRRQQVAAMGNGSPTPAGSISLKKLHYGFGVLTLAALGVAIRAVRITDPSEFQLVPLLAALPYRLFGVHEWIGRAVSVAFFAASLPVWALATLAAPICRSRRSINRGPFRLSRPAWRCVSLRHATPWSRWSMRATRRRFTTVDGRAGTFRVTLAFGSSRR